jgi:geranylgeranyl pyrophosphate synthase
LSTVAFLDVVRPGLDRVEAKLHQLAQVDYPLLATILHNLFDSGGKRLRPALVFLAAGFGPADQEQLAVLATAVEMAHTATLVHDDLIDNSLLRRGSPTVNALWHGGVVVLVGDYIFAKAAEMAAAVDVTAIGRLFGQTLAIICEGEIRQASTLRSWQQNEDEYFRRIYAKTASLFAASSEASAILTKLTPQDQASLRDYGRQLGMAFQVVDDVLDFVGSESELGKPVGSDLRQGTITLPVIHYMHANPDDPSLRLLAESGFDDEERVTALVGAIRASPAIQRSYDSARDFADRARAALIGFADNDHRRSLLALADYAVARTR